MSSASAPTDSVGSRSNIGTNAADAFARIHTPPSPVPTNMRPLTVGSATTAVTRPVTPVSADPSATPPKVGISSSKGSGPSAFHANVDRRRHRTGSVEMRCVPTAPRSCMSHLRDRLAIRTVRHAKIQPAPAEKECFPRHAIARMQRAGRIDIRARRSRRRAHRRRQNHPDSGGEQQAARGQQQPWRETSGQCEGPPSGPRPVVTLLSLYIRTNYIMSISVDYLFSIAPRLTEYSLIYDGQRRALPLYATRRQCPTEDRGLRRSGCGDSETDLRKVIHDFAQFGNLALDRDLVNRADDHPAGHRIERVVIGRHRDAGAGLEFVRIARVNILGSRRERCPSQSSTLRRDPSRAHHHNPSRRCARTSA